ncbi:hypothetical protein ERJ75_000389500 [Trypanosoma vivax]|nr:hypothetical protein ERJ75_000389500 [Trypanosoma vivax]
MRRRREKALVPPVHAVQRGILITGLAPARWLFQRTRTPPRIATEVAVQRPVIFTGIESLENGFVRGTGLVSSQHGTGLAAQAVRAAVVHAVRIACPEALAREGEVALDVHSDPPVLRGGQARVPRNVHAQQQQQRPRASRAHTSSRPRAARQSSSLVRCARLVAPHGQWGERGGGKRRGWQVAGGRRGR